MDIQYVYIKKRHEFGRQCRFADMGPKLMDNLMPNKELRDDYVCKTAINRSTQYSSVFAEHEINTMTAKYDHRGMNHTEGGWPREVHAADEEQTMRFRKKIEKDEMYIHTLVQLTHAMERSVLQNNAINIYEEYFEGIESSTFMEHCSARTLNVFRDPNTVKRPVTHLSWSPDGGTRLAVSHCNLEFQRTPSGLSTFSYIWEVESPNKPQLTLKPTVPITCLEYNPKDLPCLVSGMFNGQVAVWDSRKGSAPVDMSVLEFSHRDPVYNVLWINSKSGTEFFSSSTDGQVKWWDMRKLNEPSETLILDIVKGGPQVLSRALGASCLEYEGTIPTRFMVGTESGYVISCNRKGKTPAEKIAFTYPAHFGPVYALQRNPSSLKNFLTVGDWMARIWSEDCKESSIMWTCNHEAQLTDGAWSPTRPSVFFTTRMDGTLDAWDILHEQREAVLDVKVCDSPLRSLRVHEKGQFVAVGNNSGTSYLVEFSENLATTQRNDKILLAAMFERETHREKILEARNREIRLRQKTKMAESSHREPTSKPSTSLDAEIKNAEEEFFTIIKREFAAVKHATKEAPKGEEEHEINPEGEITEETETKKKSELLEDELEGKNSEHEESDDAELEGEDMDVVTEGTNEDGDDKQ